MQILITNDDSYTSKGIKVLAGIMSQFGEVTVIAPKTHQSGMSMAVSLGLKPIAYKKLSRDEVKAKTWNTEENDSAADNVKWSYLDATPASCVKFGLNTIFLEQSPDVVISGINHGSNASSASCYSGTLGAAQEAALNDIPAFGVSIDTHNPDADFSVVTEMFPMIYEKIISSLPKRYGIFYNINFPDLPLEEIKGIAVCAQGIGKWIKEFMPWNPEEVMRKYGLSPEDATCDIDNIRKEEGETIYAMTGQFIDDDRNALHADHQMLKKGYVTIVPHNLNNTDYQEMERIGGLF